MLRESNVAIVTKGVHVGCHSNHNKVKRLRLWDKGKKRLTGCIIQSIIHLDSRQV